MKKLIIVFVIIFMISRQLKKDEFNNGDPVINKLIKSHIAHFKIDI